MKQACTARQGVFYPRNDNGTDYSVVAEKTVQCEAWRLLFYDPNYFCHTANQAEGGLDRYRKSLVDLGCNFGFYSFYAAQKGAARVVGIDSDPDIIRGCQILARHYRIANVEFRVADFIFGDVPDTYDIALMVDFIGKNVIRKEKLLPCLSGPSMYIHEPHPGIRYQ